MDIRDQLFAIANLVMFGGNYGNAIDKVMVEVNKLYKCIAELEQQLAEAQPLIELGIQTQQAQEAAQQD